MALKLHYSFEENGGTVVLDRSNNGNTGTLTGPTHLPTWVTGKRGYGIQFDGIDDSITIGTGTGFDVVTSFTVSVWIKSANIGAGSRTIFYRGTAATIGGYALNQEANKIKGYFYGGGDWQNTGDSLITLAVDTWYHIVLTYNKITLQLYINGVIDKGAGKTSDINVPVGAYTQIGGVSSSSQLFDGIIDDVRFYNTALSPAEILEVYHEGALALLLNFDEGNSGTIVLDRSGNGNTGTITGATWTTGKIGGALSFTGAGNYVTIGDNISLRPTKITISAWCKPSAVNDFYHIIEKTGSDCILNLENDMGAGKRLRFYVFDSDSVGHGIQSDNELLSNIWYNVVGTYDGIIQRLYVNGIEQSQTLSWSGSIRQTEAATHIGSDSGHTYNWNGLIDDVRVYDVALTAAEALAIYNETNRPLVMV